MHISELLMLTLAHSLPKRELSSIAGHGDPVEEPLEEARALGFRVHCLGHWAADLVGASESRDGFCEHLIFHLAVVCSTWLLFFNLGNLKYLNVSLGRADFQPCHRHV